MRDAIYSKQNTSEERAGNTIFEIVLTQIIRCLKILNSKLTSSRIICRIGALPRGIPPA